MSNLIRALLLFSAITLRLDYGETAHVPKYPPEGIMRLNLEKPWIIIKDGTENDTYFGASMALHRSDGEGWLFVGAPKANDDLFNISKPGKVWLYNFHNGTSSVLSTPTDAMCPAGNTTNWTRTNYASCDDMFLSGSVVTSKDNLITCAPRWGHFAYNVKTDFRGHIKGTMGACYWMSLSDVIQSHSSQQVSQSSEDHLLIPFADHEFSVKNARDLQPKCWEPGQFGFATHVSNRKDQLIAGAVGVFDFDGGVILPSVSIEPPENMTWRMFSVSLDFIGKRLKPICQHSAAVASGDADFRQKHSGYVGYSVTSGRYFNDHTEMVAASAPRARGDIDRYLLGSIFIMDYNSAVSSGEAKKAENTKLRWKPNVTIRGGVEFSYFGASMESLDINKDGLDDLIVGAPLECGQENGQYDLDCSGTEDAGCIYIYSQLWKNVPALNGSVWTHTQRICSDVPWGRFGSTIARLGDVDQDGFNDFAVGAPYEEEFGAVYVYFGREDNDTFKYMKISGNLRNGTGNLTSGFGQSIIGDVDLDGNGTPDFAVGNHLNQTIAVFRTRPRLNIKSSIKFFQPGSANSTTAIKQTDEKFQIKYCLNIELLPSVLTRQKNLTIRNQLIMDKGRNRFQLEESNPFNLTFLPNDNQKCIRLNAKRSKPVDDLILDEPEIKFSAKVSYDAPNASEFISLTRQNTTSELQVEQQESLEFCIECPYSILRTFDNLPALTFARDCMERGGSLSLPVCKPVLNIKMHERTEDPLLLGNMSSIDVIITVRNERQPAYKPTLTFSWKLVDGGSTLTSSLLVETLQPKPCVSETKLEPTSSEKCQLMKEILRKDREETTTFRLHMDNVLALRRSELPTKLELSAEVRLRNDPEFIPVANWLTLNITVDANVMVFSSPVTEQIPLLRTSGHTSIDAKFRVKLNGKSPVRLKLFVGLPRSLPSAQDVFQITTPESWKCIPTNGTRINWAGKTALDKLKSNISTGLRVNCLPTQNQDCEYFDCEQDITLQKKGSNIDANFGLGISRGSEQQIEGLMDSARLGLVGFAYAYIFEDRNGTEPRDHSACLFELTLSPPEQKEIEAWIIIVAAAAGLVLLSCVIFGLSMCGFFKRENMDLLIAQKQGRAESERAQDSVDGADGDETGDDTF